MPRKIEQAKQVGKPPLESNLQSARQLNSAERLLTPKDTADFLRVSCSWLAKARMRGDGPPYMQVGRSIRYDEGALLWWAKSRLRLSTSEPLQNDIATPRLKRAPAFCGPSYGK